MSPRETVYHLEEGARPDPLFERLRARFATAQPLERTSRRTYYDTFDWRLFRARRELSTRPMDGGRLVLLAGFNGEPPREARAEAEPTFAAGLPPLLRTEVLALTRVRRLLPLVELREKTRVLGILDEEEKTVVRVVFEGVHARAPQSRRDRPLPSVLRVVHLRGYEEEARAVQRFLEDELGLEAREERELALALSAIGRDDQGRVASPVQDLEPHQRSDEALKQIHRALFATVLATEAGTRERLDIEFLHDFRVAVRRIRSALGQVPGVFPEEVVAHFSKEFSWLGSVTGPARDTDVFLEKLDEYAQLLAPASRLALAPLRPLLEREVERHYRALRAALDSPRYAALVARWQAFLEEPLPLHDTPRNARRPIGELASRRIYKAWRKVATRGRGLTRSSPAELLHSVRIRCKKLRYLLEFFRKLYPKDAIGPAIKELKRLQDNLGDFNDYCVHQESLHELGRLLIEEPGSSADALLAIGRLAERLELAREDERERFQACFAEFDAKQGRRRFKSLFAKPASGS